ncbi:hypothetical protein Tsp_03501 [Trichinella spiralis]|uniref:hypothetical protein n=1 Tax=Trichinella spiralis TaxID=6334 RepID=UPI0001EFB40F|nr:hypothetical protein Tsp_03501 [Trichinella spiralis]
MESITCGSDRTLNKNPTLMIFKSTNVREGGREGGKEVLKRGGGAVGKEKKETKAGLLLSRQTARLRLGKVCNARRYRLEKEEQTIVVENGCKLKSDKQTDRQKKNKTKSKQTLKGETGGIKRTTNIFSLWDGQCRDRSGVTQSVRECGKPVPLVGKRGNRSCTTAPSYTVTAFACRYGTIK